jgi:acid phosphatase (class A)
MRARQGVEDVTLRTIALTAALIGALGAASLAGYAVEVRAATESNANPMPPETRMAGYLPSGSAPSSLSLVPEPPKAGSSALARDEEGNRRALALHGTPRWELAAKDSMLTFPALADTFACALNVQISEEHTPKLAILLRRTMMDAGFSTYEAKRRYQRQRPFMTNGKPICTPEAEKLLRMDGSYPSGHAAIGWTLGLVLTEVSPEQANALLARGRAFGQSREVCNVHWPSDVLEGQMMGSAIVARLHAEPAFRSDVEAARVELAALRTKSMPVARDCTLEAKALTNVN